MDVSVIIVNYNTRQMTSECIDSIFDKTKDVCFEVILVDNASTDGSKEHFEHDNRITYIYNEENLGFGRANNVGAKVAKGKYLFLLNSDTLLIENSIKSFFDYMELHPEIASCGANLLDLEGKNGISHGMFPSLRQEFFTLGLHKIFKKHYKHQLANSQTIDEGDLSDVNFVLGADIFIRASVFIGLGGFDEDFFMYYEETDLYYRMSELSKKSVILPDISIIHFQGGSTGRKKQSIVKAKRLFASKVLFYKKHKSSFSLMCLRVFSVFGELLRFYKYPTEVFKRIQIVFQTK